MVRVEDAVDGVARDVGVALGKDVACEGAEGLHCCVTEYEE